MYDNYLNLNLKEKDCILKIRSSLLFQKLKKNNIFSKNRSMIIFISKNKNIHNYEKQFITGIIQDDRIQ